MLRALLERVDTAAIGTGSLLLIGGSAGVGKSRLINDMKRELSTRRIRTIEGRCSSTESSVPYAPFMDALRFRIAKGDGEAAAHVLGPLRTILSSNFPELEANSPQLDPALENEKDKPFEMIFGVLSRLSADEPLLLVLEDIHWADQTSLELIHRLAHRLSSLKMLLIATYRSDELHATHPLRRLLGTLARDRVSDGLTLQPLDPAETEKMLECLLGEKPDPEFASAIWSRSEGNPFFIEELVSVVAGSGGLVNGAEATALLSRIPLPATIRDAILARITALHPLAVETISAAAVVGRVVEFEELRAVLAMSELELLEVIEELVSHQLLREERSDRADCFAFPHALMQEAIYENIVSRRRRVLHRRVAAAIERRPRFRAARLDALAYHYRLGGDHARASNYAQLAGDEAMRLSAWDEATAHYENLLLSLEALGDHGERTARAFETLADIAWRLSRSAAGNNYAQEALRMRRERGESEDAARLLRRLAAFRIEDGDTRGAKEALDEALQLLGEQPDTTQLGAVYDDLGRLSLARGDLDAAGPLLMQGLSLASEDTKATERVLAMASLGELRIRGGRLADGIERMDVALRFLRNEDQPVEQLARAYAMGASALLLAHQYERTLAWTDAGYAMCVRQSVVGTGALFRALRAAVLTITTGSDETIHEALAAVNELRRTGRAELRQALRILGFIQRIRGELDAARRAHEESRQLRDRRAQVGLALVALAEGRPADAADVLVAKQKSAQQREPLVAMQLLPYAIDALIAVGRVDEAADLVDQSGGLENTPSAAAELAFASGLLKCAQGRTAEGRAALRESAEGWEQIGNRLDANRVRVSLILAALADGDTTEGFALGRKLLDELTGSVLSVERESVTTALRKAGMRPKAVPLATPVAEGKKHSLTPREQAVLREVSHGGTNRQIAHSLGITEKTVSVHVSHILAKLGCKTRTGAARLALELFQ